MTLKQIQAKATNKNYFKDLNGYIAFCNEYLEFIKEALQAIIVSQNENIYQFYQYNKSGNFQITRPINSKLMYSADSFPKAVKEYQKIIKSVKDISVKDVSSRELLNNIAYTLQQSIGAALDSLPAGSSNEARKLNGDLFENLIRLIIKEIGVECSAGVVQIPVIVDNEKLFNMSYQHDLVVKKNDEIKIIGSIKTSSKDRIDKIFIDKFLYNRLTETQIPHVAIFLNDVQRKNAKKENEYGINSTFLPGHFKGYSIKLNPLDGVYYCDIRPNMKTEELLKRHIKTFDHFLCSDIWKFVKSNKK